MISSTFSTFSVFRSLQKSKCSRPFPHVFPPAQSALQSTVFKSKYLIPRGDIKASVCTHHTSTIRYISTIDDTYMSKSLFKPLILNNNVVLQPSLNQYRHFQTSTVWFDKESKVEKTVKALKEDAVSPSENKAVEPTKKSLRQKFVVVVKHYYHGFRLLFIDIAICRKLIWRILNGKSLTRRESNQVSPCMSKSSILIWFNCYYFYSFVFLLYYY